MSPAKKRAKAPMTEQHKDALSVGREEGRVIRRYLEALDAHKPKRGRRRTPESIERQLAAIEESLLTADPLSRVQLIQQRMDLGTELAARSDAVDLSALEAGFVKVAKGYGTRKRISYAAWREAGVSAATLQKAGIGRSD